MRIAIIGAGISGIGAAHILKKNGHEVTIFEKSAEPGGVWANAYPQVRLQNSSAQYHFSDFPWPFKPDTHPTAAQIKRYLNEAVDYFGLDLRLNHEITSMKETENGWLLAYRHGETSEEIFFDYVVSAIGQYSEGKNRPQFKGEKQFQGQIITEREVYNLDDFEGKEVVVLGFGKSAVDMATFAASRAKQVYHVFRTARWLVPLKIFGLHYSYPFFCRFGSIMVPSWAYPSSVERFLHKKMSFLIDGFWNLVASIFRSKIKNHSRKNDQSANERLKQVEPQHGIRGDLRSAAALAPKNYYKYVAEGKIRPYQSNIAAFMEKGVVLKDGQEIAADMAVLSIGSKPPVFPFLPEKYRKVLEKEVDGVQLYRHLIHPEVPRFGFAGFNHGFMHIPAVEVGTLWLNALITGDLVLPSKEEMLDSIEEVQTWKRKHIHFESSRNCAVNIRFQQYLDTLLKDIGLSPYRKFPNVLAEVFQRYGASDYKGLSEEYRRKRARFQLPLQPLPVNT